jgi:hypothetical protein
MNPEALLRVCETIEFAVAIAEYPLIIPAKWIFE